MKYTDEQVYTKIEEIYKTEKGKPFITHLVRSFLPVNRSTFMLSNEKNKLMRCTITGTFLISKEDLITFQLDNVDAILKNFGDRLLGNTTENIVEDNFKGKLLAVECEKSNKLLCLQATQQLLNFAVSEYLKGNKHIGYVIKAEKIKEDKVVGENKINNNNNRENKPVVKPTLIRATTKLGDSDVLQKLKEKLENGGK